MTTLAQDVFRDFQLGEHEDYPVIASDIIYRGAAVGDRDLDLPGVGALGGDRLEELREVAPGEPVDLRVDRQVDAGGRHPPRRSQRLSWTDHPRSTPVRTSLTAQISRAAAPAT